MGTIMLSTLSKWNRWGQASLKSGHLRDITAQICRFADTKDIIVLTGLRRAGKTTVLFQIMDYLETQQVPQQAMLHINFEEPALASELNTSWLQKAYDEYRASVYPTGKVYLFLDEIQNLPEWERWVRARNESENIKIFLTGSSANLMSRELGTLLTGRHLNFAIYPLSFKECLAIKNIALPKPLLPVDASAEIQNALQQYLRWGSFPEVVLSDTDERRELLLKQYLDDLLFKDVAMRYQIRDISLLRHLAIHLLTQTASLISFNRLSKQFGVSLEVITHYCSYLQEAFLIDFIPFYSLKVAQRNRHPQKVHVIDSGLRYIAALSESVDLGRLMESLVYQTLKRCRHYDIYYWKGKHEIDFLIKKGNTVTDLLQVSATLDNQATYQREVNALQEASQEFQQAKTHLVAGTLPQNNPKNILPLWYFMISQSDPETGKRPSGA